nr:AAA family ATPase [Planobispora rosea]
MTIMPLDRRETGNLPAETTRLVGRRAELAELRRLCERSRLVTVTGPGGVGKTRLALRAVAEMAPDLADGAWWVTLSPLELGASLPYAIAEALWLVNQTTDPMIEVLADYLAGREALLLWDTCEHLAEACAPVAERLLAAAPGLRILATSRRRLGAPSEETFALEPLSVEDGDAVALLAERAAEALPGFAVTVRNRQAVLRICRRLEGLPLAIELAAARLGEWPLEQLAARLDDRFAALETEAAAYSADPPWHQALRTAIGWSHQWCSPAERLLWARLSVFAGSFEADAAAQVCADAHLPAARIPDLLTALTDKSLLTWTLTGDGERYRMLDTLREFGAFWLAQLGEHDRMRRRHRDHYRTLARQGAAAWMGPEQFAWYDRVTAELDNLRAALEFALAEPEEHCAAELAGNLWFCWICCGFPQEGRHYLERALAVDTELSPERTQALWACGMVLVALGDGEGARTRGAECVAAAESLGDARLREHGLMTAVSAMLLDDPARGPASHDHRIAEIPLREDELTLPPISARQARAIMLTAAGRTDEAVAALQDLRAVCARYGERWARAYCEAFLARAELARGSPHAADVYARSSLEVRHRLRDRLGAAMALDVLACAAADTGRAERAAWLLGLAQRLWDTLGRPQAGIPEWVAARQACEKQALGALGDHAYRRAFRSGHGTDLDTGVAYALSDLDVRPPRPTGT